MRALVTGAAGFIGSRLAEQLLGDGHGVVGVDRISDYYEPGLKRANVAALVGRPDFEMVEADVNELELAPVLRETDVVFHLAGRPGVRGGWGADFEVYLRDNVLTTQRLLEAARDSPIRRLVLASSSSVYGDVESYPMTESSQPRPISPYGVTKLAAERLCSVYSRDHGVPVTILRYFTIFGPRQRPDMAFSRFLDAMMGDREVEVFGDGRQVRDFTYVDDAVAATIAAADRAVPGGLYNVAGGTEASVLEAIEIIGDLVGSAPRVTHLPGAPGDLTRTAADTTLARSELSFAPRTSLEQGLALQLAAHLRARGR